MAENDAKRPQEGSNFRRLAANLRRDAVAISALAMLGIDEHMLSDVGLGLKEPYVRSDGTRVEHVLTFPVRSESGRRRYAYLNIPGHTLNPEHELGWGPGQPEVVSTGAGDATLIVCTSAIEVWQVGRAAHAGGLSLTAISSSQPGQLPAAWMTNAYWRPWGRVVLLETIDLASQRAITRVSQRPIDVTSGSIVANGCDDSAMHDRLLEMINLATRLSVTANDLMSDLAVQAGDFDARPISVHGGVAAGLSYYAFTVERRLAHAGQSDRLLHAYQALVIRSDGELLEAITLPSPRGTPTHRRVHALSDGTRITALPDPGHHSTWSLSGIRRFVAAREAGEDPCYLDPRELAESATDHLRGIVDLPSAADYWRLTAFVMASYSYRIFDALPIMHIHGDKGSGKSELTGAMVGLGFNGEMMSQGSASALVRLVRESGGLVALDDAEVLAAGGGEIGQALKQGYKQATALKIIAHPGGRTEAIDFFGPRVVCNTLGLDPVLASRAIRIATRALPDRATTNGYGNLDIFAWRDAAHAFGMSRLETLTAEYVALKRHARDRRSEIWAPLKAIAAVVGHAAMIKAVSTVD